jgi:hypothetical protein
MCLLADEVSLPLTSITAVTRLGSAGVCKNLYATLLIFKDRKQGHCMVASVSHAVWCCLL